VGTTQTIDLTADSGADPSAVWRLLSDSSSWPAWTPIDRYRAIDLGDERGVGEVRLFENGRKRLRERIVERVPGRRLAYELISGLAIRDYLAEVDLTPAGEGGTRIRWRAGFEAKVPGSGRLYRREIQRATARFAEGLAAAAERVREIPVPPGLKAAADLSRVDYEDAFAAETVPARQLSARQWAEAVLERAPVNLRRAVLAGWSEIGFELRDGSPERSVLGWQVRHLSPGVVVLAASSPLGIDGELVFESRGSELRLATLVTLEGDRARRAWARIEPEHRRMVPRLLEHATLGGG
jgi:uncharacterized protein YndB with AHSA1/START domain